MATPPAGLEGFGPIQVSTRGGNGEWLDLPPARLYTNAFIIKSGKVTFVDLDLTHLLTICKILLGHKKRGIGEGL